MKNTRDSYYGFSITPDHPLIINACKQLDELNIDYDIDYFPGECSFLRCSTTIKFKETQDDDFLKTKITTTESNIEVKDFDKFKYEVIVDSDNNLLECDNWLEKNVGPFNEKWIGEIKYKQVNTYYFVNDTDAMHFKLMWS